RLRFLYSATISVLLLMSEPTQLKFQAAKLVSLLTRSNTEMTEAYWLIERWTSRQIRTLTITWFVPNLLCQEHLCWKLLHRLHNSSLPIFACASSEKYHF